MGGAVAAAAIAMAVEEEATAAEEVATAAEEVAIAAVAVAVVVAMQAAAAMTAVATAADTAAVAVGAAVVVAMVAMATRKMRIKCWRETCICAMFRTNMPCRGAVCVCRSEPVGRAQRARGGASTYVSRSACGARRGASVRVSFFPF